MRRLSRSKGKRLPQERELVLLEGLRLLEAALDAGLSPETVLATPELLATDPPLLRRLARPPLAITATLLEELADADSPRGLLATARLPERPVAELSELVRRAGGGAVVVLADGLQDPANLGALARTAEAAGSTALVCTPRTVAWRHPRSLRASTGSLLRLPVFAGLEPSELRHALAPLDGSWVALVPRGGEDLYRAELGGNLVLAVGAEAAGLAERTLAFADRRITIPLAAGVESLNAHVAAAVVLFELRRRAPGR
jgi:TrmH family RNA methyltransferase